MQYRSLYIKKRLLVHVLVCINSNEPYEIVAVIIQVST